MSFGILAAAAALFLAGCFLYQHRAHRMMLMAESDNDMKFFPQKGAPKEPLEPSAEEIDRYFQHKRCHNLDRARELGIRFGRQILAFGNGFGGITLSDKELFHARILYLFVTEDCVRHFVPDPILSKLVTSQINDTISDERPHFYNNLVQYRAYTLYKLCLQQEQDAPLDQRATAIGCSWAMQADNQAGPADETLCQIGKKLYLLMKERCDNIAMSVAFEPV